MAWTSADLTAVETAIRKRISGGAVDSYAIGGRNVAYMPLEDLRSLRDEMRREIEAKKSGLPTRYVVAERRR